MQLYKSWDYGGAERNANIPPAYFSRGEAEAVFSQLISFSLCFPHSPSTCSCDAHPDLFSFLLGAPEAPPSRYSIYITELTTPVGDM